MRNTTRHVIRTLLLATALSAALPAAAASFVYRGSLTDRGEPAEGEYGFRLTFYDAQFGGTPLAPATTLGGVAVSAGAFNANLELDPALQARDTLWLEVEVRDAAGNFVPLTERQAVAPKAIAAGVCWDTQGNSGTNPTTDFLGTIDNQALRLRVNNISVMRYEPGFNIVAGPANAVLAGVSGGTIAGGIEGNEVTDFSGTIGGGRGNRAGDAAGTTSDASLATVGGGFLNVADATTATVGGGENNRASGVGSAVTGGELNIARGDNAAIGGGRLNETSGAFATVPGGALNCAGGDSSFAAGMFAQVRPPLGSATTTACNNVAKAPDADGDEGTFAWGDALGGPFVSTGPNQFLVRAGGGMALNTTVIGANDDLVVAARTGGDADADLILRTRDGGTGRIFMRDVDSALQLSSFPSYNFNASAIAGRFINTGANGAHLTTGGAWTNGSSRAFKEAFAAVDPLAILDKVLALPLSTWRYKGSLEGAHLGPMAEDFSAAFGLGGDDQHIATVDADGVALAAIQGLNEKLERENSDLREQLTEVLRRVSKLEAARND